MILINDLSIRICLCSRYIDKCPNSQVRTTHSLTPGCARFSGLLLENAAGSCFEAAPCLWPILQLLLGRGLTSRHAARPAASHPPFVLTFSHGQIYGGCGLFPRIRYAGLREAPETLRIPSSDRVLAGCKFPSLQDVEIQPPETKDSGPDPGPQLRCIEGVRENTQGGGGGRGVYPSVRTGHIADRLNRGHC
jgi:hypothetical protein